MNALESKQEVKEWLKVSYQGPGFPLDNDIYFDSLRQDQKRSILKSIIAKEARRSPLEMVGKYQAKDKLRSVCREIIADEIWSGVLSPDQGEQKYYFERCGIFGEKQTSKEGKERFVSFHSNRRRDCADCAERYHKGKSFEKTKKIMVVMQAKEVKHLRKFRLTFPDFIRDQIKGEKDAQIFRDLANRTLQEFYGCSIKKDGGYKDGSVWIEMDTHWYSSKESWRKSFHLHPCVIPLRINGEHVENVDRYDGDIPKPELKRLRRNWSNAVREGAKKLGYKRVEDIQDELVVNHRWIDLEKNLRKKGSPGFNLKYDMRSAGFDLEKAVKAVSFKNKIVIMFFERKGYAYYAIWPLEDYAKELRERLQIKNTHTVFGWGTRFKKHAPLLGIDISEEKDTFEPDPNLTVRIEYKRQYKGWWNKEKKRLEMVKRMFFRELTKPDQPGHWQEVDPWAVHGEEVWTPKKMKYSYKARSPDREN